MIPIRAVAEELGCWVSYCSAYDTVEIYNESLTAEEMTKIYAMEMPEWWTEDGVSEYASAIMNVGTTAYANLSEMAVRTMLDSWTKGGTLPSNRTGYSGIYMDYTTASKEEVTHYLAQEVIGLFETRFTSEEYGVTADFRTNTGCIFYAPYYSDDLSRYYNYGLLTVTFESDADIEAYAKYHYMGSFDISACKPGESYTFLLCSLWSAYGDGEWKTYKCENVSTGPNTNDWW
jgi:hypothetical protein